MKSKNFDNYTKLLKIFLNKQLFFIFASLFLTASISIAIESTKIVIHIPTMEIKQALNEFAKQTGFSFAYAIKDINSCRTNAVNGKFVPEQALATMLDGTGVGYKKSGETAFSIKLLTSSKTDIAESSAKTKSNPIIMAEANSTSKISKPARVVKVKSTQDYVLEDTVITASKRESKIQQTPIAVTAINAGNLDGSFITDIESLQAQVPGMVLGAAGQLSCITIRGISAENVLGGNVGGDSGIAYHVNGIVLGRPQSASGQFYDIDRIEVLRGPQGTLYGRNATGGTVNILTRMPASTPEGYIDMQYGNLDHLKIKGAVSGPILGEKLLGRFAFLKETADGYIKNIYPDGPDDFGDKDLYSARGTISSHLSDNLEFSAFAEYFHQDNGTVPMIYAGNPRGAPGPQNIMGGVYATGPMENNIDYPGNRDFREFLTIGGKFTWDLGAVQLSSNTGYHKMETEDILDLDGTQVNFSNVEYRRNEAEQFSQEFQLTSQGDGAIEWLLGGFFFTETGSNDQKFDLVGIDALAFGFPASFTGLMYFSSGGEVKTTSYALFGQTTWHATDKIHLTAGLRWTEDEKESTKDFTDMTGFVTLLPDGSKSWSALTPKVGISYDINESTMIYASATKGFKSGGYNVGSGQSAYEPEFVWSYEAGIKADLFDRLRVNLTGFHYTYDDQQFMQILGYVAILTNAASSTINGFEAEFLYQPKDNLQFNFSYAYLDATFDSFASFEDPYPELGVQDLSGNVLPRSPEHSVNVGTEYSFFAIGDTSWILRGEYSYRTRIYFSEFNREYASQKAVGNVNLFLNFETSDKRFYGGIFARNLTDERTANYTIISSGNVGFLQTSYINQPRTYGLQLGYRF